MPSQASVQLSLIIPAYNESAILPEAVRRIEAYMRLKGISWELVIVNDGSTDETAQVLAKLEAERSNGSLRVISYEKNRGKGFAVKTGVLAARGESVLLTDADLSAPIKEADKLLKALSEGNDVAIGSRALRAPGCDVRQTLKRRLSGRVFNFFVRTLLLPGLHDTQCGFKAFTAEVATKLFNQARLDGFSFDVEILFLAKRSGCRIAEIPVMWSQGPRSKVSLWRDSTRMFRDLFIIKKIHACRAQS